jgi:hypothetical protein
MFILFDNKNMILPVWSSYSSFSSFHSPSSSLSLLSYTGPCQICHSTHHSCVIYWYMSNLPLNTPLVCHILVHVKSATQHTTRVSLRSNPGRTWGKQVKTTPLFLRIEIILPKCPNFVCQNGTFNKKNSTQTMISCLMSCNSRFV